MLIINKLFYLKVGSLNLFIKFRSAHLLLPKTNIISLTEERFQRNFKMNLPQSFCIETKKEEDESPSLSPENFKEVKDSTPFEIFSFPVILLTRVQSG